MESRGNWLTTFVRGVQLEALTEFSRRTTTSIFYMHYYILLKLWYSKNKLNKN